MFEVARLYWELRLSPGKTLIFVLPCLPGMMCVKDSLQRTWVIAKGLLNVEDEEPLK